MNPRVSVCIPSFNHAPYLAKAIDSVLAQTYRDFEIVIVDDGSTDDSLEIAEGYASQYPELVRVLTHPDHANRGISETVNLAYQQSRGEFWSGLPSDDMLLPEKLERQIAFLDDHQDIGWTYSYATFVDEAGQPHAFGLFGKDITKHTNPLQHLLRANVIPGMTAMMRRSCTDQVGLHEPGLMYSDWEFWLRMTNQCPVAFMPQPLVKVRVHSYNSSGTIAPEKNARRGLEVLITFRQKTLQTSSKFLDDRTRALLELQLAYHFFYTNDESRAKQSLSEAFAVDRTLASDSAFFGRWLRDKIFDLQHTFPFHSRESSFASWLHENLQSFDLKLLAQKAKAAHFAKLAFENYRSNAGTSRRMALNCLREDFSWIRNRSVRTIALKGLLGLILTRHPQQNS